MEKKNKLTASAIRYRANKDKWKTYYANNKELADRRTREWQKNNDKTYSSQYQSLLKRKHRITLEEYNALHKSQNGCCAACGIPQEKLSKRLAVDHDHVTGKKRELLCIHCNLALGQVKDNVEVLQKLIDYLNKHSG
jgi:hypothetical protein